MLGHCMSAVGADGWGIAFVVLMSHVVTWNGSNNLKGVDGGQAIN